MLRCHVSIQTYSNSLETEAANWTNHCDFDADIYGKGEGYVAKHASKHPPDHVSDLASAFNSIDFYYGVSGLKFYDSYTRALLPLRVRRPFADN